MRRCSRNRSRGTNMDCVPPCSCLEAFTFSNLRVAWINAMLPPQWEHSHVTQTASSGVLRHAAGIRCRKPGTSPVGSCSTSPTRFSLYKDRRRLQAAAEPRHPASSSPSQRCRPGLGSTTATLPPGAIQSPKPQSQHSNSKHSVFQFVPIAVDQTGSFAQHSAHENGIRTFAAHVVSFETSTPFPPSISSP